MWRSRKVQIWTNVDLQIFNFRTEPQWRHDGWDKATVCLLCDIHTEKRLLQNQSYSHVDYYRLPSTNHVWIDGSVNNNCHAVSPGASTIFFQNITGSAVKLFLSLKFWWILLHSSKIILMISSCQHASRQSARTALIFQKVSLLHPLHPDTLSELQQFPQQLLHHYLVFSPCLFFTLNHSFLTSCVQLLTTM